MNLNNCRVFFLFKLASYNSTGGIIALEFHNVEIGMRVRFQLKVFCLRNRINRGKTNLRSKRRKSLKIIKCLLKGCLMITICFFHSLITHISKFGQTNKDLQLLQILLKYCTLIYQNLVPGFNDRHFLWITF